MPTPFRIVLGALTASVLLIGCAHDKATPQHRPAMTAASSSTSPGPARHATPRADAADATSTAHTPPTVSPTLPEKTGIGACDDYLSSYLACHRAAQIYSPEQLPIRFEAMRTSLLRDSMDPTIRPQLANRCNSLATQLRQALHGKACAPDPVPTPSSR